MSLRIEEMLVESELDLAEMGELVDLLAPLGGLSGATPAPSDELAELFDSTAAVRSVSTLSGGRRSAVAGAVVLALSAVGATGLSAAANTLPRPLQHGVSQFSQRYLPFDLPEPPQRSKSPLGTGVVPPTYPSLEGARAGGDPTSRSIPGRDPALAPQTTARPAPESAAQPAASPSAGPSYAAFGANSAASPSPDSSPSGSPSPDEGTAGRPASSPSDRPDKKPDKGNGKGGHDGKGKTHGPGSGTDPGGDDPGAGPVPGGQDPTPPQPLPDVPVPTLPLPDPLPDLGPIGGTGAVDPGADAG